MSEMWIYICAGGSIGIVLGVALMVIVWAFGIVNFRISRGTYIAKLPREYEDD